ncbi:hypothetical protein ACWGPW_23740 [Paenibacillus chitinolyticus]
MKSISSRRSTRNRFRLSDASLPANGAAYRAVAAGEVYKKDDSPKGESSFYVATLY